MAGQTSFSRVPPVALEGMVNDDVGNARVLSRVVEDAAGIAAGRVVQNGTVIGRDCKALTATGQKFLGVTVLDLGKAPTTPRNLQKDDVGILDDGIIHMICVDDMRAVTGPFYICFSGSNAGLPQASAIGGDLAVGFQLLEGGNAGELGKFRVNLP